VQFQFKATAATAWSNLGSADTASPFETTLDPAALSLAYGSYDLRALATDQGGRTDPAPAAITVTYGDVTPPAAPEDLIARVDGHDVSLAWTASSASDLAGYNVYRDGTRITASLAAAPALADAGREAGLYAYQVTAVDRDGNESARSALAVADVYALALTPRYPVTEASVATVVGEGGRDATTVTVLRQAAAVASGPGAAGHF